MLVYPSALSTSERHAVQNYLTTRYVSTAPQTTFDAAADFSPTRNTASDVWQYGYTQGAAGAFTRYTTRELGEWGGSISRWGEDSLGLGREPSVRYNRTSALLDYYSVVRQTPDELNLHPNKSGANVFHSVVRWTAPAAGIYLVQGRFDGDDYQGGTTSDARITRNAASATPTSLFAANVIGFNTQAPFTMVVTVAAGDTLDFATGVGKNNDPNHDSTGFAATITRTTTSIAGRITAIVAGVTGGVGNTPIELVANGAVVSTATTDLGGNYAFPNLTTNTSYTVRPVNERYTFTPATRAINVTANHTADFTASRISHEADADFSTTSNPAGAWSYGFTQTLGAGFNLLNQAVANGTSQGYPGLEWWVPSPGNGVSINHNKTGQLYVTGGVRLPAGMLWLHPGAGGQNAVVRWTAPLSGTYRVTGRFEGIETGGGGTTSNGSVLRNNTVVASGNVNGFGAQAKFNLIVTLSAGETINFAVGYGSNYRHEYDSTGLDAAVVPIPGFNIAGRVTSEGEGLRDSILTLTRDGATVATKTADADGYYYFANLAQGGNYLITVARQDFAFATSSQSFANLTASQTADFAGTPLCATAPPGMVAWYRGNNNTNDSLTNNQDGTIEGATFTAGRVGQAFNFDSTGQAVALGDPDSLRITGQLTVDAWVKPQPMADGQYASLVAKWSNVRGQDAYMLYLYKRPGGQIEAASAIGVPYADEQGLFADTQLAGAVRPNEWNHVAMTYDPTTGLNIIYVNGVEAGKRVRTGGINSSNVPVFLGRRHSPGSTIPLRGALDEVSIYNRALTGDEIYNSYVAREAGRCGPPPFVLAAAADTWVQGSDAFRNTNYGTTAEMQVKRTLNPGAGRGRRSFIRFDTARVTGDVTGARLRVFARLTDAVLPPTFMIVQKVTDTAWNELGVTWNNQPGVASPNALAGITVAGATGAWYEFDLTNFIRQERAAGRSAISFRFINTAATGNSGVFFTSVNSKEASENQPQLTIVK